MNTTLEQTHHETIDRLIETTERRITNEQMILAWLHNHWRELVALVDAGIGLSRSKEGIDFDNPTREQVITIIKAIPGKWDKDVISGEHSCDGHPIMNYCMNRDGIQFRMWNTGLPPTCKIVKRVIPAQAEKVIEEVECNVRETEAA